MRWRSDVASAPLASTMSCNTSVGRCAAGIEHVCASHAATVAGEYVGDNDETCKNQQFNVPPAADRFRAAAEGPAAPTVSMITTASARNPRTDRIPARVSERGGAGLND